VAAQSKSSSYELERWNFLCRTMICTEEIHTVSPNLMTGHKHLTIMSLVRTRGLKGKQFSLVRDLRKTGMGLSQTGVSGDEEK